MYYIERMPCVLAIESSCDETAVALLRSTSGGAHELLASVISSQIDIHAKHGGVVPEIASRNHSANLPDLLRSALQQAGATLQDIDIFAATAGPGLASSLLVGNSTAKALAWSCHKPFIAVNHLEGHLVSPFLLQQEQIPAHIALIVSGGHTMLLKVEAFGRYELLGRSLDDAAGEAFDKVGKLLGLGYPGGPQIDRLARHGDPARFKFPRALLHNDDFNFSFSGLKTSVLYCLEKLLAAQPQQQSLDERTMADLCASFQQAVVDVLVQKALRAMQKYQLGTLAVSGGVVCNSQLRASLMQQAQRRDFELHLAAANHSTDNAAMIACVAVHKARAGMFDSLGSNVDPNLALTDRSNRA